MRTNGATITIVGVNIDMEGQVIGNTGGRSGKALTFATGVYMPPAILGVQPPSIFRGGRALSIGSEGGFGGDVGLCARDSIHIGADGRVIGGTGGGGGFAKATANNGSIAYAQGGPGNQGGDVIFTGTDSSTSCQVSIDAGAELRRDQSGPGPSRGRCERQ